MTLDNLNMVDFLKTSSYLYFDLIKFVMFYVQIDFYVVNRLFTEYISFTFSVSLGIIRYCFGLLQWLG